MPPASRTRPPPKGPSPWPPRPAWSDTCSPKKTRDINLNGKSAAALADQVLPALTAAMSLLKQQDPAEADNFRRTVLVAVEAATRTHQSRPSPTVADMTHKITEALDAA
jgi:hypothetical protein